jgi:hypothetical protein
VTNSSPSESSTFTYTNCEGYDIGQSLSPTGSTTFCATQDTIIVDDKGIITNNGIC